MSNVPLGDGFLINTTQVFFLKKTKFETSEKVNPI
jgi:hypothetical protein